MEEKKRPVKKKTAPKPQSNTQPEPAPVDARPVLCKLCKHFHDSTPFGQPETITGMKIGFLEKKCTLWNWMFMSETEMAVKCLQFQDVADGEMIDLNPIHNRMDSYEKVEEELIGRLEKVEEIVVPIAAGQILESEKESTMEVNNAGPVYHIETATINN